ncbi:MAG: ribosome maturation factor RimP [Acidimicrobiales bacterium]
MDLETPLRSLLSPLGLNLYDVELAAGTLNVTVNKDGGVDLEALTKANRVISEWLDINDPIAGRFTLDVSSPGLERRLRTPDHFRSTVGEVVTLRELREGQSTRRLEGAVLEADDTSVTLNDEEQGRVVVLLSNVERARTVFKWGAQAKPSPSRAKKSPSTSKKG